MGHFFGYFYGAFVLLFFKLEAPIPIHCNCMEKSDVELFQNVFFVFHMNESHAALE